MRSLDDADMIFGQLMKYDVSLALQDTSDLIRELQIQLRDHGYHFLHTPSSHHTIIRDHFKCVVKLGLYCFGHLGDQNLHLNIMATYLIYLPKSFSENSGGDDVRVECVNHVEKDINQLVYELIAKLKGV
jgi:hypothetical protein